MPITRAEAGRLQLQHLREEDPEASDDDDSVDPGEESNPEADEIIRSVHTKLRYDTSQLSPTTEGRAKAGLKEAFTLGHCSLYNPSQSSEYFAFQIFETVNFSVRIGAPDSEYRELTCHCDNDPRPCRHIFWLLDQIAEHTLTSAEKAAPLPLTKRGFSPSSLSAYHQITSAGPRLFQELDCELRTSPDASYPLPPSPSSVSAERIQDVRDILSTFTPQPPSLYRPDIFASLPASPTATLFPDDLEKTLAHALLANDDLFRHLRTLVPTSHCATTFFHKQRARTTAALAALDAHIATRAGPAVSVAQTGAAIGAAVAAILARVHEARSPLSGAARRAAAEALCLVLLDVAGRDADVYDSPVWARSREQALPLRERNLFVRLFGGAAAEAEAGRERFIVDGLADLGDAARGVVGLVEEARERFEANRAPRAYAEKLAWLAGSLKAGEVEAAGMGMGMGKGGKRLGEGGGAEGRGSKRMK